VEFHPGSSFARSVDGYPIFERALFGKELEEYQRRVAEAEERTAKLSATDREKMDKA
jgi:hypothetical protein